MACNYDMSVEAYARCCKPSGRQDMPAVSVIIPTYNEEQHIGACLESLLNQTHPSYEVIVVDDGSMDRTVEVVKRFEGVRLFHQDHRGPGQARNLGAEYAQGEILVFVDADMSFAPDFIERLIQPIHEGKAIGTNTKEEYVANLDNRWALCWNINRNTPIGHVLPEDFPDEWWVMRAIRREDFLLVGGYDNTGYEDDESPIRKLGIKARAAPGAVCYHNNPASLREVFASARWIGKSQQAPKTFLNLLRHTPPWSLKNSVKRTIRYRNPFFPIFKVVFDFGILNGIISAWLFPQKHWK